MARIALKILRVESARELGGVIASVGLAQNLAALRALASEGIQSGHMKLHARQVAVAAGAVGAQVEQIAQRMIKENTIRIDRAQEMMRGLD
jgi:hydroxymethylglutaryl-CoA reductase